MKTISVSKIASQIFMIWLKKINNNKKLKWVSKYVPMFFLSFSVKHRNLFKSSSLPPCINLEMIIFTITDQAYHVPVFVFGALCLFLFESCSNLLWWVFSPFAEMLIALLALKWKNSNSGPCWFFPGPLHARFYENSKPRSVCKRILRNLLTSLF